MTSEPGRAWPEAPLVFERSREGRRAGRPPRPDLPVPELPSSLDACNPSAAARGGGARDRPSLHHARRPDVRRRHGLLPARLLHDEAQPARERARRRAPRVPRSPPSPGGRRRAGRARADVAPPGDARRDRGSSGRHAATRGRLAGRADRAHAHARVLRRPRRRARHDHHGGHRARDEPRERDDGRVQARAGRHRRARQPRPRRPPREGERADCRPDADEPLDARPLRRGHRGRRADLPRGRCAPLLRRREPERRRRDLAAR